MVGSVNKVILVGNLGADPEIHRSGDSENGLAVLSIATSENWRDKNSGEHKERTEWHRVVIYNRYLIKLVEKYLKRGSKVYLEGQLQTRKWQDKNGNERYKTEIVLQNYRGELHVLDSRVNDSRSAKYNRGGTERDSYDGYNNLEEGKRDFSADGDFSRDLDDEIPF